MSLAARLLALVEDMDVGDEDVEVPDVVETLLADVVFLGIKATSTAFIGQSWKAANFSVLFSFALMEKTMFAVGDGSGLPSAQKSVNVGDSANSV
jgi:hypothetical protein